MINVRMSHEEFVLSQRVELRLLLNEQLEDKNLIPIARSILSKWRLSELVEDCKHILLLVAIDSSSDHLPFGEARQYWNSDALLKIDKEAQEIHDFYLDEFLETRLQLLAQLDDSSF